jgi:hypothetical protein
VTDIDCSQYLATSPKTGEVWTRGGRVIVGTKAEWEGMRVGMLIPAPHRPFGAVELVDRPEEVTVGMIAAIITAKREELSGLSHKGYTAYRMAEAIHDRVYGPSPRMGEPPAP